MVAVVQSGRPRARAWIATDLPPGGPGRARSTPVMTIEAPFLKALGATENRKPARTTRRTGLPHALRVPAELLNTGRAVWEAAGLTLS